MFRYFIFFFCFDILFFKFWIRLLELDCLWRRFVFVFINFIFFVCRLLFCFLICKIKYFYIFIYIISLLWKCEKSFYIRIENIFCKFYSIYYGRMFFELCIFISFMFLRFLRCDLFRFFFRFFRRVFIRFSNFFISRFYFFCFLFLKY